LNFAVIQIRVLRLKKVGIAVMWEMCSYEAFNYMPLILECILRNYMLTISLEG